MKLQYAALLMLLALLGLPACNNTATDTDADGDTTTATDDDHGHQHHGDELTWVREELESDGYVMNLGHHGPHADAGHALELAATVTKDGEPVSDAKVFVSEVAEDGTAGDEKAMTFEPATDDEPAHYAQAEVTPAEDAKKITVRFRFELPGAAEFVQDVPLMVESHH